MLSYEALHQPLDEKQAAGIQEPKEQVDLLSFKNVFLLLPNLGFPVITYSGCEVMKLKYDLTLKHVPK